MTHIIKLLPDGVESCPLFSTDEEYQKWRQDFIDAVAPEMEKHRIARMRSERESMFRIVD